MLNLLHRLLPSFLFFGLAFAALIGWGSFAYVTWSARHLSGKVSSLLAERNKLIAERNEARIKVDRLEGSNLWQVEAQLSAARAEYNRKVEQTGSIRTQPPKRITR
jgi:hypothetical protein